MAITITLTETRPDTGIKFHSGSDELKTFIQEAVNSGKVIDNGGGVDETGFIRTWSFTFPNDDDYIPFRDNDLCISYEADRDDFNNVNGITKTLEIS